MKVKVSLYGTLGRRVPGYRHSQGIVVELQDGATVNELLVFLGISESQKAVVEINGRIQKANDEIPFGAHAKVFQPMHGG